MRITSKEYITLDGFTAHGLRLGTARGLGAGSRRTLGGLARSRTARHKRSRAGATTEKTRTVNLSVNQNFPMRTHDLSVVGNCCRLKEKDCH